MRVRVAGRDRVLGIASVAEVVDVEPDRPGRLCLRQRAGAVDDLHVDRLRLRVQVHEVGEHRPVRARAPVAVGRRQMERRALVARSPERLAHGIGARECLARRVEEDEMVQQDALLHVRRRPVGEDELRNHVGDPAVRKAGGAGLGRGHVVELPGLARARGGRNIERAVERLPERAGVVRHRAARVGVRGDRRDRARARGSGEREQGDQQGKPAERSSE